jgi:class 3 adenylate cyclase
VLLISGIDDSTLIGQCLRAGASDYIRKPYDATILAARVAATLERKRLRDRERRFVAQLDEEKRRAEALLGNILPEALVDRLGRGERSVAERFDAVTVLFADIAGFTSIAARLPAGRLVADLDRMVSAFDSHATELGVEKIKTVGDAYLAVAGLPEPIEGHADLAAALAVRMVRALCELAPELGTAYELRCGLHTGPVVAGVIGTHKFSYDVWGDTVNIASRLQTLAAPGEILLSGATRAALRPQVRTTQLGPVELRGRGVIETHRLEG